MNAIAFIRLVYHYIGSTGRPQFMAHKVVVELVDDYDGKFTAEETVAFAVDGVNNEIDLSTLNAAALRSVFERWTSHARKVGRTSRAKAAGGTRTAVDRAQTQAVRRWAHNKGWKCPAGDESQPRFSRRTTRLESSSRLFKASDVQGLRPIPAQYQALSASATAVGRSVSSGRHAATGTSPGSTRLVPANRSTVADLLRGSNTIPDDLRMRGAYRLPRRLLTDPRRFSQPPQSRAEHPPRQRRILLRDDTIVL